MSALLELEHVSIAHGAVHALSRVSLSVAAGEAVALIGTNGAGKSTMLRAIMGLDRVAAGVIRLAGRDVTRLAPEHRARLGLGYCPEGRRIFPGMSVADNLLVASRAGSVERRRRRAEVEELFPPLAERARTPAWQLSGGQQQMLAIGRALMGAPRLLLLDEPSLGLAPGLAAELLTLVRRIARGGVAVLIAEQNLARALALCDRGYILERGRIVEHGPPSQLRESRRMGEAWLGAAAPSEHPPEEPAP
jgi:branched-chain amino acid transport system ATP-binding protein